MEIVSRRLPAGCPGLHDPGGGLETRQIRLKSYFLRRLLLIPPTLVGITLLVFTITRFVPGGPMDRMLQEATRGSEQGGKRASSSQAQGGLSEEQLEELEEQFGLNKPVLVAYGQWLGVVPREVRISKGEFGDRATRDRRRSIRRPPPKWCCAATAGRCGHRGRDGDRSAVFAETGKPVDAEGWKVRYETKPGPPGALQAPQSGSDDGAGLRAARGDLSDTLLRTAAGGSRPLDRFTTIR